MNFIRTALTFLACALVLPQALASPRIEGIQLISTTRYDRTNFDYTFALKISGDENHYTNTSFSVKSMDPNTKVIKDRVATGPIDAKDFIHTNDVFVVRHDRSTPIDYSKLSYYFSGSPAITNTPSGVSIGAIAFMEAGGRPLHEGVFRIQDDAPPADTDSILAVNVFGSVTSATYSFVDIQGSVLSQGMLQYPQRTDIDSPKYYTNVTTPRVPFKIKITAYPATGASLTWQSGKIYYPKSSILKLIPTKRIVSKGETISSAILVKSTSLSGSYQVAINLPSGFTSNFTNSNISLYPGSVVAVPITITAPSTGPNYSYYTVSAQLSLLGSNSNMQYSNLEFIVK